MIALCAATVLVFSCTLSLQLHAIKNPEWLVMVAAGVLIASVPASVLSALAFRQNQLALVLGAQILTVASLAAWAAA